MSGRGTACSLRAQGCSSPGCSAYSRQASALCSVTAEVDFRKLEALCSVAADYTRKHILLFLGLFKKKVISVTVIYMGNF